MPRTLTIQDAKGRTAEVTAWTPDTSGPTRRWLGPASQDVESARLIKATEGHTFPELMGRCATIEALTESLINSDPEVDTEQIGRRTGSADRVWIQPQGQVLYGISAIEVEIGPDGEEKVRGDIEEVPATVTREEALVWSGRVEPIDAVIRRHALVRKLQLRHTSGATFDVLHELAADLESRGVMAVVGSGPDGDGPLIFQKSGTAWQGFLEGRTRDGAYLLVLHMSNFGLESLEASS